MAVSSKRKLPFLLKTAWDPIWERYVFDQELCNIIFDGIVNIEVFLKSYMATELAKATGPFGYLEPASLPGLSTEEHKSAIIGIAKDYNRSSLPQLKHFKSTSSCVRLVSRQVTTQASCDEGLRFCSRAGLVQLRGYSRSIYGCKAIEFECFIMLIT